MGISPDIAMRLMAVTRGTMPGDIPALHVERLLARLEALFTAGVRLVQIREKQLRHDALATLVEGLAPLRARYPEVVWILNGPVSMVREHDLDGVQFPEARAGRFQMLVRSHCEEGGKGLVKSTSENRSLRLGRSVHDVDGTARAAKHGADFVVFAPVFAPSSKAGAGAGLDALERVCAAAGPVPVYALGGITPTRIAPCLERGAHGVAMLGGLMHAPRPGAAARESLRALRDARKSVTQSTPDT